MMLPSFVSDVYVHLRGGYIVPMQNTHMGTIGGASTTADLAKLPVEFHVHPQVFKSGFPWSASGEYIHDDGMTTNLTGEVNHYVLTAHQNVIDPTVFSIEVGMQNSGLGVFLAKSNFSDPAAAIPAAISALTHCVYGSVVAFFWGRKKE